MSEPDPIIALWAKRQKLNEEAERLYHIRAPLDDKRDAKEIARLEEKAQKLDDQVWRIEARIAQMTPRSPEGWAAQVAILAACVEAGSPKDNRDERIAKRLNAHFQGQVGTPAIMEAEHDALIDMGREMERVLDAHGVAVMAMDEEPYAHLDADTTDDRAEVLKQVIAATPARTLEGAMVQIGVAASIITDIEDQLIPETKEHFERLHWKAQCRRMDRILHSIMDLLESVTGSDRDAIGAGYCMFRYQSPFQGLSEAQAGTYSREFIEERGRKIRIATGFIKPAASRAAAGV